MDTDNAVKIKEFIDEFSKKGGTQLVVNPETMNKLKDKGISIEHKFITYDEYFENLVSQKRKKASEYLSKLPSIT